MSVVKKFIMKKRFQNLVSALFSIAVFIVMSGVSFASSGSDAPKIVTGTVNLFKAISNWLLLIIPVGAGAFLGYQALQKSMTDDQAVIAEKNKLMKNTLIGAAIAETATGLVSAFLSFYS